MFFLLRREAQQLSHLQSATLISLHDASKDFRTQEGISRSKSGYPVTQLAHIYQKNIKPNKSAHSTPEGGEGGGQHLFHRNRLLYFIWS